MAYPIELKLTQNSRRPGLDLSSLPFGRTFSDHMFTAEYIDGQWQNCRVEPYGEISFAPSMMALHYGQAAFEGMKANIDTKTGEPILFRADQHAERMNKSADRLGMPEVPKEVFLNGIHALVSIDKDWIPKDKGSALYIRPFIFATDEWLGVRASTRYKFMIITGPVGAYYPKPVSILVAQKYVRAFPGGTGFAKAAGNYAATIKPATIAQDMGFDQILWLDGLEFKYLQECGTMNIFVVIGNKVLTPPTGDSILAGVTRDSIIQLLKEKGFEIEVRPIEIKELLDAHAKGELKEMFGSGTAAVISHVAELSYQDKKYALPAVEGRKIGPMLKELLTGIKTGEIEDTHGWVKPVRTDILSAAK